MIERDDAFLLLAESTVPCKLCTMQALFHALHLHLAAHLHLHLAQALFHASQHTEAAHSQCNI